MEAGNLNDALGLLEKSLKMNKTVLGEEHPSNASIYMTLSQIHSRKKDYETAVNLLSQVWELTEAHFGLKSPQTASVYLELAKVYLKKKDYTEAINF